jgi:uncharacterized membrane protein YhaH (DUF805 family)
MDNFSDGEKRIPCPFCRELIISGAIKCKHCGSELVVNSGIITHVQPRSAFDEFKIAVHSGFINAFKFDGKASRTEFWDFYLFNFLGSIVLEILISDYVSDIFDLLLFIPLLSVSFRRMHDVGRSAAWLLLVSTGVGIVPVIYWLSCQGENQNNRFGPTLF